MLLQAADWMIGASLSRKHKVCPNTVCRLGVSACAVRLAQLITSTCMPWKNVVHSQAQPLTDVSLLWLPWHGATCADDTSTQEPAMQHHQHRSCPMSAEARQVACAGGRALCHTRRGMRLQRAHAWRCMESGGANSSAPRTASAMCSVVWTARHIDATQRLHACKLASAKEPQRHNRAAACLTR